MVPDVPPQRILDRLTRLDELLVLDLEANRKLTEAINKLVGVIPPPPPPVPIPILPAPLSLAPLADRIDRLAGKLDTLQSLLSDYHKRELDGLPVDLVGRYSGSDQTYQTLVTWRIGDLWGLRRGRIREISVFSDNFSKTRFKLTVMKTALFKDLQIQSAMILPSPAHVIPFGGEVILEAKSSDGTSIVVNGSITGREF